MSCTFLEARDYILGVFKQAWDSTGFPVVYDSVAQTPDATGNVPKTAVWARVTVKHADGYQSSLTGPLEESKRFSNRGVVISQVFGKLGNGLVTTYESAQIVADAYRSVRNSPVWYRNVRINEIGTKSDYTQINVLAEFEYDSVESSIGASLPPPIVNSPNIGPFYFNVPLLEWVINHNMGRKVGVEVYTMGGVLLWAQVTQISNSQTIVTFDSPQDGYAVVDY